MSREPNWEQALGAGVCGEGVKALEALEALYGPEFGWRQLTAASIRGPHQPP